MIWLGIDVWCGRAEGTEFVQAMLFLAAVHAALLTGTWLVGKSREARKDENKVWFALHALANAYVVAKAAPDLPAILLDPLSILTTSPDGMGKTLGMCMALHIYHAVAFTLTGEDLMHHGISVGIVNPTPKHINPVPYARPKPLIPKPRSQIPKPQYINPTPCTLHPKP